MKKIAVFASGEGSNFKAIFAGTQDGRISGELCLLISNNPKAGAVQFAKENGIPVLIVNATRQPNEKGREILLLQKLESLSTDLICLAGYTKLIPAKITETFKNRILNIHPALLPSFGGKGFYGSRVHQAVIDAGVKFSGVTVHFVNEEFDAGMIVAQQIVPVLPDDDASELAARVLIEEHKIYPVVIAAFCENRIQIQDGKANIGDSF